MAVKVSQKEEISEGKKREGEKESVLISVEEEQMGEHEN